LFCRSRRPKEASHPLSAAWGLEISDANRSAVGKTTMDQNQSGRRISQRTTNFDDNEVKLLSGNSLKVLFEANGKRSLEQIAQRLNLPLEEVGKAAAELEKQKLIEIYDPLVPRDILTRIQKLIVNALGPLGEWLLIEKIEMMGYSVERCPLRLLSHLADEIALEIRRPEVSTAFRRQVNELINTLNRSVA
jgi:DNA-binding Lrp family transcriptional regulator